LANLLLLLLLLPLLLLLLLSLPRSLLGAPRGLRRVALLPLVLANCAQHVGAVCGSTPERPLANRAPL